jgi:Flp pilus assembly protein TadG
MFGWKQTRAALRGLQEDRSGIAALEFAFFAGFLSLGIVNLSDVGVYLYKRMEVENAAMVGTMSARKACDPSHLPATLYCSGLNAAVTASIQSTSLGSAITLSGGAVSEGYYCVNSSNVLQLVSGVSSKPADCSAAGMPALQPADYIVVAVTYSYSALFQGISVAGLFATPITKTAMARML